MNNIDLEIFHKRIKSSIKIAGSYIGNKRFGQLVRSCRLKPLTVFSNSFKPSQLEYEWADEFGNIVRLQDNKVIPKLEKTKLNTQISTDLFYGLDLLHTIDISKAVIIFNDYVLLYGEDEYFRCFTNNKIRVSPLSVGIDNLLIVMNYIGAKYKSYEDIFMIYALDEVKIKETIKEEYK